jgi:hypothetical protein
VHRASPLITTDHKSASGQTLSFGDVCSMSQFAWTRSLFDPASPALLVPTVMGEGRLTAHFEAAASCVVAARRRGRRSVTAFWRKLLFLDE